MSDENPNGRKPVRTRAREYRKNSVAPHLVGDCEDLLPYSWGNPPVIDEHKRSKVLREMSKAEARRMAPPAKND